MDIVSLYFTEKPSTTAFLTQIPHLSPTVFRFDWKPFVAWLLLPSLVSSPVDIPKKSPPKLCELDPIPTKLLFGDIDVHLPTVTHIINTSLSSGSVPLELKTTVVKPLLKKPSLDKNVMKNYSPISDLPFVRFLVKPSP